MEQEIPQTLPRAQKLPRAGSQRLLGTRGYRANYIGAQEFEGNSPRRYGNYCAVWAAGGEEAKGVDDRGAGCAAVEEEIGEGC